MLHVMTSRDGIVECCTVLLCDNPVNYLHSDESSILCLICASYCWLGIKQGTANGFLLLCIILPWILWWGFL